MIGALHPSEPVSHPYMIRSMEGIIRTLDGVSIIDFGTSGGGLVLHRNGEMEMFRQNLVAEGKIGQETQLEGSRVWMELHFLDVPWIGNQEGLA